MTTFERLAADAGQSGIYRIVLVRTDQSYVGSAVNFKKRWEAHRRHLTNGCHHSKKLQHSWSKHGAESFRFDILETILRLTGELVADFKIRLLAAEQFFIDSLLSAERSGFNICHTAGSTLGLIHTPEARAAISAAQLGRKQTPERRAKRLGKRPSPASIAARSATRTGKPLSKEHRAAISLRQIGIKKPPRSQAHCEAIRLAKLGKKRSPATVAAMSAGKLGKKLSPAHCAALSACRLGKKRKKKLPAEQMEAA